MGAAIPVFLPDAVLSGAVMEVITMPMEYSAVFTHVYPGKQGKSIQVGLAPAGSVLKSHRGV